MYGHASFVTVTRAIVIILLWIEPGTSVIVKVKSKSVDRSGALWHADQSQGFCPLIATKYWVPVLEVHL